MAVKERLAMTVGEAVEATRVGRGEIYRAIQAGELPAVRIGRRLLLTVQAVEEWLRKRTTGAATG